MSYNSITDRQSVDAQFAQARPQAPSANPGVNVVMVVLVVLAVIGALYLFSQTSHAAVTRDQAMNGFVSSAAAKTPTE